MPRTISAVFGVNTKTGGGTRYFLLLRLIQKLYLILFVPHLRRVVFELKVYSAEFFIHILSLVNELLAASELASILNEFSRLPAYRRATKSKRFTIINQCGLFVEENKE